MSKAFARICHGCVKPMRFNEGIVSSPPLKAYWHTKCAGVYLETAVHEYSMDNISRDTMADILMAIAPILGEIYNDLLDRALEEA